MKGRAVFFLLGAGASVDSGMKTYRSTNDSYYKFDEEHNNPLDVAVLRDPNRMQAMWDHLTPIWKDCTTEYGPTYVRIKEICAEYDHFLIANQNIDGLADIACGSDNVVHLHGDIKRSQCLDCYEVVATSENHKCDICGGWLRPNIVLFGESCNTTSCERIWRFIADHRPEVCYVVGSSMRFSYLFAILKKIKSRGGRIIHVNTDPEYRWHLERLKFDVKDGQLVHKNIKKKKPETLLNSL